MVQGTMSSAGKSLIVAGLCRVFKQDGYRVAPFKSQNMALNSFITRDGYEMGRAQVMQAEASGIEPMVCMNPILLKPNSDIGSQVIVNGKVIGNMPAKEYFAYKKKLIPDIKAAFDELEKHADIIVIEGAGSPAEINLKQNDIVNMGIAKMFNAPVLLVGDIDRGGVFAQLLGTLLLLEEDELSLIKGLVINKFRGDKTILDPGIEMLEEKGGIPVTGVVPYMNLTLDDEDSVTSRFSNKKEASITIGVIRLPRISNFTDFIVFETMDNVAISYITSPRQLKDIDLLIIPGSKNTIGDMKWLKETGLDASIVRFSNEKPVIGICGGFQMLGESISDPLGVEGEGESAGLSLLPIKTILEGEKVTTQSKGVTPEQKGFFSFLSGKEYEGYEIHNGLTCDEDGQAKVFDADDKNVFGTYVHGFFDKGDIAKTLVEKLAEKKGIKLDNDEAFDYKAFKEKEYDKLADGIRNSMDMKAIYEMLGLGAD